MKLSHNLLLFIAKLKEWIIEVTALGSDLDTAAFKALHYDDQTHKVNQISGCFKTETIIYTPQIGEKVHKRLEAVAAGLWGHDVVLWETSETAEGR